MFYCLRKHIKKRGSFYNYVYLHFLDFSHALEMGEPHTQSMFPAQLVIFFKTLLLHLHTTYLRIASLTRTITIINDFFPANTNFFFIFFFHLTYTVACWQMKFFRICVQYVNIFGRIYIY